jgi:hypothetical protein
MLGDDTKFGDFIMGGNAGFSRIRIVVAVMLAEGVRPVKCI